MDHDIDWVDFPDADYTLILGYENAGSISLNEMVRQYNSIPKDQEDKIDERMFALSEIEKFIHDWIANKLTKLEKIIHLQSVGDIARKKRNYLEKLKNIPSEKILIDYEDLVDSNYQPIFLNSKRLFSLKIKDYWGDFYFEALDPCHRKLTPFVMEWEKVQNRPPFFLWLETQYVPKYMPKVKYLTEAELEKAHLVVENGIFVDAATHQPANFSDPKESYIFVLDLQKRLFAARESAGCSHSSFTHGRGVLGAGALKIDQGHLKVLAMESGHYLPTIQVGYNVLRIFAEMGYELMNELEISYIFERDRYRGKISRLIFDSSDTFFKVLGETLVNED